MNVAACGRFDDFMVKYRSALIFLWHVLLVAAANAGAFYLRFEGDVPAQYAAVLPFSVMLAVAIRLPVFSMCGLHRGMWRYAGFSDLNNILATVTLGSALFFVTVYGILGYSAYPRSVFVLDWLLTTAIAGGGRFASRSYHEFTQAGARPGKKTLIIGAGDAGELIVRDMQHNPDYLYEPVGLIDDDGKKKGLTIHGVPVLGTRPEMPGIIKELRPDEIVIAMPSASPGTLREIMKDLSRHKVPIKTLPCLKDVLDGRVSAGQIRRLRFEDLLSRAPVSADMETVSELIRARKVMVTGAGGTIGSELCRQAARYGAGAIIAYERHENSLYNLDKDFRHEFPSAPFHPVVGDVTDMQRLHETVGGLMPDIVFHAAAHKHVPMMEMNPREAIKNNLIGTKRVASVSRAYGVKTFVLISTDKAVNPTSVMGASKRACELLVSAQGKGSRTRCITVRFGNVLGSSGSVVPLFREQIQKGGPVTVTHPDIERYLMLIPEAVQLVMQAASIGNSGDILVLDMGEPIKIADLARNLIALSGFEPDKDIKIEYVGLRPGEKLYEELFDKGELVAPTPAEKVFRAVSKNVPDKETAALVGDRFERLVTERDTPGMIRLLADFIKTYNPDPDSGPARMLRAHAEVRPARPAAAAASISQNSRPPLGLTSPAG